MIRFSLPADAGRESLRSNLLSLAAFAAGFLLWGEGMAAAQTPSAEAIEAQAKKAIGERAWYDPGADRLVPLKVKVSTDDSIHRDSRWLPKPKKLRQAPASGSGANSGANSVRGFLDVLGGSLSLANLFAWGVLILLVVVLVALLVYAYSRIDQQPDFTATTGKTLLDGLDDEHLAERIEQLPEELRQQTTDLRSAAERWMREGKFDQAIILLFGHQLLLLDRRQLIRLSRGKTNRQYLNEARSHAEARSILRGTVEAFESSYFGRHPLSGERFATLWSENQRLEAILAQHHEAVA